MLACQQHHFDSMNLGNLSFFSPPTNYNHPPYTGNHTEWYSWSVGKSRLTYRELVYEFKILLTFVLEESRTPARSILGCLSRLKPFNPLPHNPNF